jgi:hypothetical protein
MRIRSIVLLAVNLLVLDIGLLAISTHRQVQPPPVTPPITRPTEPTKPQPTKPEVNISIKTPGFLTYAKVVEQMKRWEQEAKGLVTVGVYGKTGSGTELHYIRLNRQDTGAKPKVLVMASIHGNEPLASSTVMCYIGNLLAEYGKNDNITRLVDSRDIYFIPVVSPDSFPKDERGSGMQRYVEGVDPNRNFPTANGRQQSVPTVKAIQNFFESINPNAAISGHTWGRLFLKPWGDSVDVTPSEPEYQKILGQMSQLSGYKVKPCSVIYGKPISGTEVDWFYRHGAFALVIEYGTHQQVPTMYDIQNEFDRTYPAFLLFLKDAPEVKVAR